MVVLCYGDSNTYGYDPRGFLSDRYPEESRWVDILAKRTGWQVNNLGENGRRIPGCNDIRHYPRDLTIVMLGTNDILEGLTAEECAMKMENFLAGQEPVSILVLAPPVLKPGAWTTEVQILESGKLGEQYAELCRRMDIRFLDSGSWSIPLAYDGVHFTEEGNRIFGEKLTEALNT